MPHISLIRSRVASRKWLATVRRSNECQIADFSKHKKLCRCMSNVIAPATMDNNWTNISGLHEAYTKTPLPKSSLSNPIPLPLECLIPFFLTIYSTHQQCSIVQTFSPALLTLKVDNDLTVVTLKAQEKTVRFQRFVSFKTFNNGGIERSLYRSGIESMKAAFLQMSYFGKCSQLAVCFGFLVIKSLTTHQMTFGGEKVVGWAIQDGYINLDHSDITKFRVVDLKSTSALLGVLESVKTGAPLPKGLSAVEFERNTIHVWLTFVTESGRIFDLDLSAFQFGTMTPFPCIVPVLREQSTAFNGLVNRHRLLCTEMVGFTATVMNIFQNHVNCASAMSSGKSASMDAALSMQMEVVDKTLAHAASNMKAFVGNPESAFWSCLKDIHIDYSGCDDRED